MKYMIPMMVIVIIASVLASVTAHAAGDNMDINAQRGKELWNQQFTVPGQQRSCVTCHTADPRQPGKHARTGKLIKPMAPSVNPDRLTDQAKIEKWFKRNCKWTLGRACTEQEKGDVLEYLNNL